MKIIFFYFEEEGIEYVVKCKMNSSVKKIISYINENSEDYFWQPISSKLSVTEITVPLPSWQILSESKLKREIRTR